jgi:hypothetical protein
VSGALGFMTSQNDAFNRGNDRLVALQNLRYAFQTLEVDLTTVGSNVPSGQPSFVYGGDSVIAFTADYSSNVANDVSAVYINTDFPTGWVVAPPKNVAIPATQITWPDTVYQAGAVRSPAEFIMFYFVKDNSTARDDDYVLHRKVNNRNPEVVARRLLKLENRPFLRYYQEKAITGMPTRIDSIPDSRLPILHGAIIHGSIEDTASSALADSVRAVRVNFRSTNGRPGSQERFANVSRVIYLPNSGFGMVRTCGDEPINDQNLAGSVSIVDGAPVVSLSWSPVVDQDAGERDVVRYVIYRRDVPATGWEDPYLSIPAGQASYALQDRDIESGRTYQYSFAAQDCTPTLSGLSNVITVTIP